MLGREQSLVGKKRRVDSIIVFIYSINLGIFLFSKKVSEFTVITS